MKLKTGQLLDSPSTAGALLAERNADQHTEELMSENAAGPQHHKPMFLPTAQAKGQVGKSLSLMVELDTSFRQPADGLWFSLSDQSLLALYRMIVQQKTSLLPHFMTTLQTST